MYFFSEYFYNINIIIYYYRIYRRCSNLFLSVLTLGLTTSIIGPMFINVGGVMKLMPLTGIPLPFVSAGGSAMLFMWAKVGILMRINKISLGEGQREREA